MCIAAEFDPEILNSNDFAKALGPEQVRSTLVERDDVLVGNLGQNPLLLAPHARPVGPLRGAVAIVK